MRQRIRWLAVHGVIRAVSKAFAKRGDPQGRLIADPAVRADPVAFTEELRAQGPIVRCRVLLITVDHKIVNDVLRSDDFHVIAQGIEPAQTAAVGGQPHQDRVAAPARTTLDAFGRTARPHPLPKARFFGVHPQSGCGAS